MKLPYSEVKFYPDMKPQTGLSLLRVSCKRAVTKHNAFFFFFYVYTIDIPTMGSHRDNMCFVIT